MENNPSTSTLKNVSAAVTTVLVNTEDADAVPENRSERKLSITEALYSQEAADIELELPKLGPELRPVDFEPVLEQSGWLRTEEKTMTDPRKKPLTDEMPTDAAVSEEEPGLSTKRNIVEALYSPETADLEWDSEQPESVPFLRQLDL